MVVSYQESGCDRRVRSDVRCRSTCIKCQCDNEHGLQHHTWLLLLHVCSHVNYPRRLSNDDSAHDVNKKVRTSHKNQFKLQFSWLERRANNAKVMGSIPLGAKNFAKFSARAGARTLDR